MSSDNLALFENDLESPNWAQTTINTVEASPPPNMAKAKEVVVAMFRDAIIVDNHCLDNKRSCYVD